MEDAGAELEDKTGKLTYAIESTRLEDRVVLSFHVVRRDLDRTMHIFDASHRPAEPYPVAIDPPKSDIPEFLKRRRFVAGKRGLAGLGYGDLLGESLLALSDTPGKYVTNEWVCATPIEFRQKMTELFAKEFVTARIVSLLAADRERSGEAEGFRQERSPDNAPE